MKNDSEDNLPWAWLDIPGNFWDDCGRVARAVVAALAVVACLLTAWLIVGALT